MTNLTHWKSVACVAAIFVAGGIAGASVALSVSHHSAADSVRPREMAQRLRHRLESRLDLTPAQVQKVDPIVVKLGVDMKAVHMETMQRLSALLDTAEIQIAAELTPDQKLRLEAMQKERHAFFRNRREPLPRRARQDLPEESPKAPSATP